MQPARHFRSGFLDSKSDGLRVAFVLIGQHFEEFGQFQFVEIAHMRHSEAGQSMRRYIEWPTKAV